MNPISILAIKFYYNDIGFKCKAIPLFVPYSPEYNSWATSLAALPYSALSQEQFIFCCFKLENATEWQQLQNYDYGWATVSAFISSINGLILSPAVPISPATPLKFEQVTLFSTSSMSFDCNPPTTYSGFIPIPVDLSNLYSIVDRVYYYDIVIEWQFQMGKAPKTLEPYCIISNPIQIATTLDLPVFPWSSRSNFCSKNSQENKVWHPLLMTATNWARGSTSQEDVVKSLANSLRSGLFIYNYSPMYAGANGSFFDSENSRFYCSAFIEYLYGLWGDGNECNCSDLANALMLMANSLGCKLLVGRILCQEVGAYINLNPIIPLGQKQPVGNVQFSYHDIAYLVDQTGEIRVFDCCLELQDDCGEYVPVLNWPLTKYLNLLASNQCFMDPQFKQCSYCIY